MRKALLIPQKLERRPCDLFAFVRQKYTCVRAVGQHRVRWKEKKKREKRRTKDLSGICTHRTVSDRKVGEREGKAYQARAPD
jgi:hypothetical protein